MREPCPSPSALERLARGEPVPDAARSHAVRCAACAEVLAEIRENERFLKGARTLLAEAGDRGEARAPLPRDAVRGFELEREISRGGQGVVYRAVQIATKRPAAIKVLLAGAFASDRQRLRFEREVEIAARLRHPNIVSVFESGETSDGTPYVAMEYVEGVAPDTFIEERLGSLRRSDRRRIDGVVELMRMVAEGVGHAHTAGVIHRDLKPSNILVDAEGRPRVLDFGLARAAEPSRAASMTQEFVGTPAYASPEQLAGDPSSVNARTDVYALGLVFYTLLTGKHPYPADGALVDIARHAAVTEPTPPSRLVPRLPSDVETIVLKCLSKAPERRYANAVALASDLDDYLRGRPISARRDSTAYVLKKLALRHRVPTVAGLLIVLTIIAAAVGMTLFAADRDRARRAAEAALATSDFQRARLIGAAGDIEQAERLLWRIFGQSNPSTDAGLFDAATSESRRSVWALAELYARLPRLLRFHAPAPLRVCGRKPDGSLWAILGDGSMARWSDTGELLGRTPSLVTPSEAGAVGGSDNGAFIAVFDGASVSVHDASGARVSATPVPWEDRDWALRLTDDGSWCIAFDAKSQEARVIRLGAGEGPAMLERQATFIRFQQTAVGMQVVAGATERAMGVVTLYDIPHLGEVRRIELSVDPKMRQLSLLRGLLLTDDGAHLFVTFGENLLVFDVRETPARLVGTVNSRAVFGGICLDPTNTTLTAATNEGTIKTFRVPDLQPISEIPATRAPVWTSSDLEAITCGDVDGTVSVYEKGDRPWLSGIPAPGDTRSMIDCARDGTVAWCDGKGQLSILRPGAASPIVVQAHDGAATGVAISPALDRIATTGFDGRVRLWTMEGRPLGTSHEGARRTWGPSFSADGAALAFGEDWGSVSIVRDSAPAVQIGTRCDRIPMTAFSPDGSRLLCATIGLGVVLCDAATGEVIHTLGEANSRVRAVAWSADGETCISGEDDRTIRFWDAHTGQLLRTASGLPWQPFSIAVHPSGDLVFVVGRGPEMLVFDAHSAEEIARFRVHDRLTFSIDLSPDGHSALVAGQDEEIRVVDFEHLGAFIRGNRSYWSESLRREGN